MCGAARSGRASSRRTSARLRPSAPERRTGATARRAVALGVIQGPTELLPVSSSAHAILVPALLGWPAPGDAETQKALETALHLGTAAALALERRRPVLPLRLRAVMLVPVVVAGYAFERPIERRMGSPRIVALTQIAAGTALAIADRKPQTRPVGDVRTADIGWLGLAQAAALVPGVSRSGAIITAARLRRFDRGAAQELAAEASQPVLVGAAALKGLRLLRARAPRRTAAALAAGALSAFLSTAAARRILEREATAPGFKGFGLYRIAFGTVAFARECG